MTNILRTAGKEHEPSLRALWRDIFEDSDEIIDYFFKSCFKHESTAIALHGERPVSMGFLLRAGFLKIPGEEDKSCAMIYGLATDEGHRNRGYAGGVARELIKIAHESGYSHVVLHPANDGLFWYYEKALGFRSLFYAEESALVPDPAADIVISVETPAGYGAAREKMLAGTAHIEVSPELIRLQEYLCGISGGGLYSFYSGGEYLGCAITEISEDTAHIKELLADDAAKIRIAGAIAARHGVKSVVIRRPVSDNSAPGDIKPFGMIRDTGNIPEAWPRFAWYGPAFD